MRQVVRALVCNADSIPEGSACAGPSKLFVMLQAPAAEEPPPGFFPKRSFQLKLRNAVHVRILLSCRASTPPVPEDGMPCLTPPAGSMDGKQLQQPAAIKITSTANSKGPGGEEPGAEWRERVSEQSLVWLQCRTSVKGLKSSFSGVGSFS